MAADFFALYYELKAKFPGCLQEYYHRAIQEIQGYDCPHPFRLLRIGGPDGQYLVSLVDETSPIERREVIRSWMRDGGDKDILWCPVCQIRPYAREREPNVERTGITGGE